MQAGYFGNGAPTLAHLSALVCPAPGSSDLSDSDARRRKKEEALCAQHDPPPWTKHRRKEFPKHATHANGERCVAMARRAASNARTWVCGASTRRLASKDLRAREAISFQNSETRRLLRQLQLRPSCLPIQARAASRRYTRPFRQLSQATKQKPVRRSEPSRHNVKCCG